MVLGKKNQRFWKLVVSELKVPPPRDTLPPTRASSYGLSILTQGSLEAISIQRTTGASLSALEVLFLLLGCITQAFI